MKKTIPLVGKFPRHALIQTGITVILIVSTTPLPTTSRRLTVFGNSGRLPEFHIPIFEHGEVSKGVVLQELLGSPVRLERERLVVFERDVAQRRDA